MEPSDLTRRALDFLATNTVSVQPRKEHRGDKIEKSRRDAPATLTSLVTCNWSADASPARSRLTPARFRGWSSPVQAKNLKHESIPESCSTNVGIAFNEGLAVVINGSYIDQRHFSALKIDADMVFYSLGNIFLVACEIPVFKSNERVDQSANFPHLPMTAEAR